MSKIGCRECHLSGIGYHNIERVVEMVRSAIGESHIPYEYSVNIYKSVGGCCGVFSPDIIIEVMGPNEEIIKTLDLKAVSKILELCERSGIVDHIFEPLKIV